MTESSISTAIYINELESRCNAIDAIITTLLIGMDSQQEAFDRITVQNVLQGVQNILEGAEYYKPSTVQEGL